MASSFLGNSSVVFWTTVVFWFCDHCTFSSLSKRSGWFWGRLRRALRKFLRKKVSQVSHPRKCTLHLHFVNRFIEQTDINEHTTPGDAPTSAEGPGTASGTWTGWAMSSISSKLYKGSASGDSPGKNARSAVQPQQVKSKFESAIFQYWTAKNLLIRWQLAIESLYESLLNYLMPIFSKVRRNPAIMHARSSLPLTARARVMGLNSKQTRTVIMKRMNGAKRGGNRMDGIMKRYVGTLPIYKKCSRVPKLSVCLSCQGFNE